MEASDIAGVGVVGAGTMGNGIAHVCALAGLEVTLVDVDPGALDAALEAVAENLARQVRREVVGRDEADAALERIATARSAEELGGADLVVEAVPEREELKRRVFGELSEVCRPEAVLASNTSSISITGLASAASRPDRVIGMHFMNPVPVMELVEVVRGLETSDEVAGTTLAFCRRLGKTPVEVEDSPGFVSNRVLMPMINEAVFALREGVAEPEAIDAVMTLGMNHPMGPLRLADLIGLDTCLSVCEVLHRELGDDKYRPCPLLRKYVAAGRLGRKAGRGFYEYES